MALITFNFMTKLGEMLVMQRFFLWSKVSDYIYDIFGMSMTCFQNIQTAENELPSALRPLSPVSLPVITIYCVSSFKTKRK